MSEIEDVSGNGNISVLTELKQAVSLHLDELTKSLDGYFPNRESYSAWVKQPFTFSVDKADVNDCRRIRLGHLPCILVTGRRRFDD